MQSYLPGVTHKVTQDQPMKTPTHDGCCQIRVVASDHGFIRISKDGEPATLDDFPIMKRVPEYLTISKGGVKVSAMFQDGLGEVYVTEIS